MADGVRPREKGTLLQKHRAPGIDSYQIHRLPPKAGSTNIQVEVRTRTLQIMAKNHEKCESDLCPVCQIPETIEHIILECKNQNISNKLKLKCQEEKVTFNIRNVLAIRTIAREACNIINLITNGRLL